MRPLLGFISLQGQQGPEVSSLLLYPDRIVSLKQMAEAARCLYE